MRNLAGALLLATSLMMPATGDAMRVTTRCEGNACGVVEILFQNECYVATNRGTRRVRVSLGLDYTFDLAPGQSHRMLVNGRCPDGYAGANAANYL